MFLAGNKVTRAVDSYAFGVLMYEVYTKKRAYSGLPRQAVIERVHKMGMRPRFPSTTPAAIAQLAQACWQQTPSQRPCFTDITEALEQLAADLADAAAAAAAGTGPPPAL
ncbi:hypothetical protein MNEG_2761 [Monoraphidium neglectum]|jgi:hypothetical protein|uniref:Serine-threonine/tyrosine-protein kinase catalytic domain-containing protein n=1 Tax=Monoraphidium neglectum TaxID=145388 RepID=A0A0D2MRI0_9CHLO|nr:hypothetical protein MNEG_2761 [Monoraphidium neglectum]KIZ05195.1 hypothetical protein MNEG_2761 [Monoraphidium neglectum]|eukprot:XP_013904214.1 hypothetical protein MNEG_2761 [Monoraphidium neglectum]